MVSGLYKSKEWFYLHDKSLPEGKDYTDGWLQPTQCFTSEFEFRFDSFKKPNHRLIVPQQLIKFKEN